MEKKKRLDWLDAAKGIAIILVVVGHVGASYNAANEYQKSVIMIFSNQSVRN